MNQNEFDKKFGYVDFKGMAKEHAQIQKLRAEAEEIKRNPPAKASIEDVKRQYPHWFKKIKPKGV